MRSRPHVLTAKEVEQAMISPPQVFEAPCDVVGVANLSREQKIEILERWELDARALQRATEENMSGGSLPPLDEIAEALSKIESINGGCRDNRFGRAPTKL